MTESEVLKVLSQEPWKNYFVLYKEDFSEITFRKTPDYFSKEEVQYMLEQLPILKSKIIKKEMDSE